MTGDWGLLYCTITTTINASIATSRLDPATVYHFARHLGLCVRWSQLRYSLVARGMQRFSANQVFVLGTGKGPVIELVCFGYSLHLTSPQYDTWSRHFSATYSAVRNAQEGRLAGRVIRCETVLFLFLQATQNAIFK